MYKSSAFFPFNLLNAGKRLMRIVREIDFGAQIPSHLHTQAIGVFGHYDFGGGS
jgi:hypothetical protein